VRANVRYTAGSPRAAHGRLRTPTRKIHGNHPFKWMYDISEPFLLESVNMGRA